MGAASEKLISSQPNSLAPGSILSPGLEQRICACSQVQSVKVSPLLNATGLPAAALKTCPTWMSGWRYTLGAVTGKYEYFRAASCVRVTHLERESVGSVSEQGSLPLLWAASEPFPVQLPLGHCREGGSTVMGSRACFWLREKGLTQAEVDKYWKEAPKTFISLLEIV